MRTLSLALALALPLGWLAAPAAGQFNENLDVPYVPSPQEVVDAMLKLADVKSSDTLIDLGCGDGRIVVTAAKKFGARAIGYDLDPERIKEANDNAKENGVTAKVKFVEKNLFDAEIKEASVVTLYLLPGVNEKLKPRLLKELKPGTRIVSHSFSMGDWNPVKQEDIGGRRIYLWIVGK
ncbi:MAG: class I SAM-dependent methyltransferase [Bryobacterales bacterium]|nr:class I SAM-dependent methyltransferase [Bryobacterales bacterium]